MTGRAIVPGSLVWRDGKQVRSDFPLAELGELLADPANLVWCDLLSPGAAQLAELAAELNFDLHTVEDALAPDERPKARRTDAQLFVQTYAAALDGPKDYRTRLRTHRVSAFVLPNALITVRLGEGFDLARVLDRWTSGLVRLGAGGLLHGLLDVITDSQDAVIAALDEAMETLEDSLFDDKPQTGQVSKDAYRLRRELVEIRRIALPMRDVVNTVIRHGREAGWPEELHGYYEDLYDHAMREAEWTESLRDLVSSIFETNLSLNDMRLNVVMKKLSGWAAIIAVPTLVTGWFGMNVPYPGFSQPLGLWLAAGITVGCVVLLYLTFKRHDWI